MQIQTARSHDLQDIKGLYELLFSDMANLQPEFFQPATPDSDFIRSIIEGENADILLAKEQNQILGFALVQEQMTPPYPCLVFHKFAYLMDLVVAPTHRGKGIGKALLQEVATWASVRGLEYVELNVLSQNRNAIQVYETSGYVECSKVMRMNV